MFNFLKKLSGKEIAMILSSGGGILLAAFLAYAYYATISNHLDHSTQAELKTASAYIQQAVTNEKVAGALDRLTSVIDKKLRQ